MTFGEHPLYGDRKRTLDRRITERRTRYRDRRESYPGKGRIARNKKHRKGVRP